MHILLYDTSARSKLYPLTLTRAVADLRFGMYAVRERWERFTSSTVSVLTDPYLQTLYGHPEPGEYIVIDACIFPTTELIINMQSLQLSDALYDDNGFVAARVNFDSTPVFGFTPEGFVQKKISVKIVERFEYPFEICSRNAGIIASDFDSSTSEKHNVNNYDTVELINSSKIFIEESAKLSFCILNASDGPIYIGKNTTIMEGCLIRGPFVLCEGAILKMGSKIYGGTTVGPYSVAGGEIKNSIILGYSNKAHDGYLGDSVIGEWCNLGAGTTNSNLKNNGSDVSVWNYHHDGFINAGLKAGVIMGDYSRTSINTSVNTGTVIGVSCNIFGEGLTPKHIPDFSWGNKESCRYNFDKAIQDISNWKKLKHKSLTSEEQNILMHIYQNCYD